MDRTSKIITYLEEYRHYCYIRGARATDKNQNEYIDMGSYKIKVYPDNADDIKSYAQNSGMKLLEEYETEFAMIFIFSKG